MFGMICELRIFWTIDSQKEKEISMTFCMKIRQKNSNLENFIQYSKMFSWIESNAFKLTVLCYLLPSDSNSMKYSYKTIFSVFSESQNVSPDIQWKSALSTPQIIKPYSYLLLSLHTKPPKFKIFKALT
jgi:hypothetical protein